MTVADACEAYLRDMKARNLQRSTIEGYKSLFRQLAAFAAEARLESVRSVRRGDLHRWREQWTCAYSTQGKRLKMLKAFFSLAQPEGWTDRSPANGPRAPNSDARPTMPLCADEMSALLSAAERKPRERALLLVLRHRLLAGGGARDAGR